jgi:ketosteroid isomerase-like protein
MTKAPDTVVRFFRAMQSGAAAEADMRTLLAHDAIYIEPFSGSPQTHKGRDKIIQTMAAGWTWNPPDMRIEMDHVSVEGDELVVHWTCWASTLPGGKGTGVNRFTLKDGLIVRLVTTLG